MAYRSGNNYYVAFGFEESLGSGMTHKDGIGNQSIQWEDLFVLPAVFTADPDRQLIATEYKSNTAQPVQQDYCLGVQDGTFDLSGNLSLEYLFLLRAFFHHVSDFKFKDTPNPAKSMVIMRIWEAASTSGTFVVDIAKGCVAEQLTLSGSAMDVIKYGLSGRLTNFEREVTVAITGHEPSLPLPDCVQFGAVEYTGSFGEKTRLSEFTLTLNNIFVADDKRWSNSMIRSKDTILRQQGTMNVKSIYNQEDTETNIMQSRNKLSNEKIVLKDGDDSWEIDYSAALDAIDPADPGRDLFESNVTLRLAVAVAGVPAVSFTTKVDAK